MKWRVILFVVFFWLIAGKIEAAQVTINATADTFVNSYAPTQNFGSVGTLEVRSRDIARSSFLQFNLSHFIPLDATVTRAYLKLYLFDNFCYTNATAPMNIRIYRVSGRWSEQSITYQSQPDASTVNGASLTLPLNSAAGYKAWDVTNIVKGWIDNQYLNYGLRTYYYSENNCQATFYAREAGEGMKPQLVVEYTPPPDRTPPQIREITAEVTATTATIRWKTYNDPSSSTVAYRRPGAQLWPVRSAGGLTVDHSVTLTSLQPQTLYQYTAKSRDAAGNEAISAVLEFTTAEAEDLTAPDISNVNVNHLSSRAVEIVWSSQEEGTGEVRYSTDRQRVSIATQAGLVTNHTVRLEPLLPATTYYFVIDSEDAHGNSTVREEDQFTTQADAADEEEEGEEQDEEENYNPLSVYNIVSDVLSPTSMRFKWWSTIDGTSWVFASADADDTTSIEDYEFVAGRNDGVDMHEVVLNNLAPATTYSYRVLTRGADDQVGLSELKTFRTDAQAAPEAAADEQPEAPPPLPAEPDSTPQDQAPEQVTDPAVIEEIRHQAQEAEKKESPEPAITEKEESPEPAVKESENLGDEDQKPASLGSKFLLIFSRFWVWIILGGVFFLVLLGILLYLLLRKKKGGENRKVNPIAPQPSGAVPSQTAAGQTVSQTQAPQKPKKS